MVLQRVDWASVSVDGRRVSAIGPGLLLLVGIAAGDDEEVSRRVAAKCAELRIFADEEGRFNRSVTDEEGEALVVSQFTLLAHVRRGRRPGFTSAAPPEEAEPLVDAFADELRHRGLRVTTGRFGAHMQVELVNNGPVTIVVDSAELERPRRG